MAKRMYVCPNCMNRIKKNDDACSRCGLNVKEMQEFKQKEREMYEQKRIEEDSAQLEQEGGVQTSQEDFAINDSSQEQAQVETTEEKPQEPVRKRHKHKKKTQNLKDKPEYTVDEDGSFNIDTRDVTFLEGVTEEQIRQTPSVRNARGDYKQEKLKWWEIYKWADRMLAKRKISKEVKKASRKIPYGISKVKMSLLCVFFGWFGIHNFYARNYKKGATMLSLMTISLVVVNVPVLAEIMGVFVGGGFAFVAMASWLADLYGLIFNKYKYRISKEEFISNLNVETRAKLGKKWINFDKNVFKQKEQKRVEKINRKKNKKGLRV